MRTKYNAEQMNKINTEESYIQKYLGEELDTILNPEAESIHDIPFSELYVNHVAVEKRLNTLITNNVNDQCVFLTGLTGCGKSSIIRYLYPLDSDCVKICGNALYIIFEFDRSMQTASREKIQQYFIRNLRVALDEVKALLKTKKKHFTTTGFYNYIKKVRRTTLKYVSEKDEKSIEKTLQALKESSAIEYYTLSIRYILSMVKELNNVIIIVDDIESVGFQLELIPIDLGLILWSNFKFVPKGEKTNWSSKIVISCRHYVYRMIKTRSVENKYIIKSGVSSQTLESYPINDEINISIPVSLHSIIGKRISVFEKKGDEKRWKDAMNVIRTINLEADNKFGSLISAIANNNIRESLGLYKRIIVNKRWIQKDNVEEIPGAFDLDVVKNYKLTPSCILRALCLHEGNIYDESSPVPNLLYNTESEESDFITLIVLQSFMHKTNEKSYEWKICIDKDQVIADLVKYIGNKYERSIRESVSYLILKRILLRSKGQAQDDGSDLSNEDLKDINQVYVSRAGFELWNQLGKSSVLFESYIDDIYMEMNSGALKERKNYTMFDNALFESCLKCLKNYVEIENLIRVGAHNNGYGLKLSQYIGSQFLTLQIKKGMFESVKAYFRDISDIKGKEYREKLEEIEKDIRHKMDRLSS